MVVFRNLAIDIIFTVVYAAYFTLSTHCSFRCVNVPAVIALRFHSAHGARRA